MKTTKQQTARKAVLTDSLSHYASDDTLWASQVRCSNEKPCNVSRECLYKQPQVPGGVFKEMMKRSGQCIKEFQTMVVVDVQVLTCLAGLDHLAKDSYFQNSSCVD